MVRFEIMIKKLLDKFSGAYVCTYDGEEFVDGYKPDRVYSFRARVWILELESSTSRKGFIGGYLKAQKYFHDENVKGSLLFIVSSKKRYRDSVAAQVKIYHDWLMTNKLDVKPTYFLEDDTLRKLMKSQVDLFSREFLKDAIVVK